MKRNRRVIQLFLLLISLVFLNLPGYGEVEELPPGNTFRISNELELPLTPDQAFDVMTGDISGWWDHHFADSVHAFYIEPKPGGKFLELFDEDGNGALHATVIYADRGKKLRYEGPLGLSGKAVIFVVTYEYQPVENGTKVILDIHCSGEIDSELAGIVDNVWSHFLFERLEPFVKKNLENLTK